MKWGYTFFISVANFYGEKYFDLKNAKMQENKKQKTKNGIINLALKF